MKWNQLLDMYKTAGFSTEVREDDEVFCRFEDRRILLYNIDEDIEKDLLKSVLKVTGCKIRKNKIVLGKMPNANKITRFVIIQSRDTVLSVRRI